MSMLRVPEGAVRNRKRLGRGIGTGVGKTSGKGHNGQNARSGGGVRPGFEGGQMPLYRRIARRGFSNYRFKVEYVPVNLDVLSDLFESGATVDLETLRARGVIGKNARHVKILGRGECTGVFTIQGLNVSAGAKSKIEAAGGSVTEAPVADGSEG